MQVRLLKMNVNFVPGSLLRSRAALRSSRSEWCLVVGAQMGKRTKMPEESVSMPDVPHVVRHSISCPIVQ